ncbi:unnamed protein product [Blepharisma stoltei]|uniref:Uncharacterized protein n=1 Tax=Blepharisma stoltei TaxID=1481888 RepID=A0AAU9JD08_9CILI|nr:unnamed protein product [Blepharisma stoltei]
MENLHKLWWREEVNIKFQVLKKFSSSIWVFGTITQLIWALMMPEKMNLVIIYIPYSILFTILCTLIWYASKKGVIWKTIVSVAYSEGCCLKYLNVGT